MSDFNNEELNEELLLMKALEFIEKPTILLKYCHLLNKVFRKNYEYKSKKFTENYFIKTFLNHKLIRKIKKTEYLKENFDYAIDYYDVDLHKKDLFLYDEKTEIEIQKIINDCLEFLSEISSILFKKKNNSMDFLK